MKKSIAIGVIALLVSAVCVSIFLVQNQKDWIMLIGVIEFFMYFISFICWMLGIRDKCKYKLEPYGGIKKK